MEYTGGAKPAKKGNKALKTVIIAFVAAALVLGAVIVVTKIKEKKQAELDEQTRQSIINSGTFHRGITVGGVDVGGMTMEQAKAALEAEEDKITDNIGFTISSDGGEKTYAIDKSFFTYTFDSSEKLEEAMALGREGTLPELQAELLDIAQKGRSFGIDYTLAPYDYTAFVDNMAAEIDVEPVNATFTVKQLPMNDSTKALDAADIGIAEGDIMTDIRDLRFDFVEGIEGYGLDKQKLIDELNARTEAREFGDVAYECVPIYPPVTVATIKESLVLRSSFYSSFSKGNYDRKERVFNMAKACGLIYGTILQPGDVLSCNTLLGARTEKLGWQLAPAVIEGGANTEDQAGGGVCQVSSTMYNAVLMGDYEVVYRQAHSSRLGYIDGGLDATINTGTIDFKWSNNTEAPIYVFTWMDREKERIWCEIYGLPFAADCGFDRIELESERLPDIEPTATEYLELSSLTNPYWMLKNESKPGYVYNSYKLYKLGDTVVNRELITNTVYKMHPTRYYVWPGYMQGTPLQAEYRLTPPQK